MDVELARIDYGTSDSGRPHAVVTFVVTHAIAEDFEVEIAVPSSGDPSDDLKKARAILHGVGRQLAEATSDAG